MNQMEPSRCLSSPSLKVGDKAIFTPLRRSFGIASNPKPVTIVSVWTKLARIRFNNGSEKTVGHATLKPE